MLRLISLIFICVAFFGCSSNSSLIDDDFGSGWNFRLGEIDSEFYNDSHSDGWQTVKVPHDWSIELGYTQENAAGSNGFLPGGVGWYTKDFRLSNSYRGKNIFVRFEGIYNNANVWINGHDLGFFPNGYLDIEYDLTPYLNSDENRIAVRVDRRAYADQRWYVGGGIYRPVHLIARNDIYIPSHAQQISTPTLEMVNVVTEVKNISQQQQDIEVKYKLLLGGKLICTNTINTMIDADSKVSLVEQIDVKEPNLWSLDNPIRYELQTTIAQGGSVVESRSEFFGIRSAIFDPSRGFLLNGESVKIKGVNIHHDLGCLGVALYDKALYRRLKKMKDLGVNAIRTSHNPHSESLLSMCDTMGLLVMNEFVDEWLAVKSKWIVQRSQSGIADSLQNGYPKHFNEWAERDIKAFVNRDYNHPSVILWSIGNEIEWAYPYYYGSIANKSGYTGLVFSGDNHEESVREITQRFKELSKGDDELSKTAIKLSNWIKEVDTTRPITSGVAIPVVSRISGYVGALDVVGYNYKDSDYESDHRRYPDKSIIGSENVGQYFEWRAVVDKPYISGIFLWTGVDYIGENGPYPAKGGTYSLFDFACFKTARGEFFETLWNETPKTHIVTTPASQSEFKIQKDGSFKTIFRKDPLRKWEWFDTFDRWSYVPGEQIVVQIYTNSPKAELLLDDKSLGVKSRSDFADENIILWQIPYSSGELVAVGLSEDGEEQSKYSLRSTSEISQIYANCDSRSVISDGRDLAHIEIELQDLRGTRVTDKPLELTITADEQTTILGVDNGYNKFVGSHKSNRIITHNGRALVIVQPNVGAVGESKIVISNENGMRRVISLKYINQYE
ncbi:MAG: sugar-binding domain-containing protein [Rikenellaceae bacterium]